MSDIQADNPEPQVNLVLIKRLKDLLGSAPNETTGKDNHMCRQPDDQRRPQSVNKCHNACPNITSSQHQVICDDQRRKMVDRCVAEMKTTYNESLKPRLPEMNFGSDVNRALDAVANIDDISMVDLFVSMAINQDCQLNPKAVDHARQDPSKAVLLYTRCPKVAARLESAIVSEKVYQKWSTTVQPLTCRSKPPSSQ